jgi:large subunit ribosomal protein L9
VKLLLAEDVKNLGKVGDIVNVKPGHARNFLLPQGLAVVPTEGNIQRIAEERKRREAAETQRRQRLGEAVKALDGTSITIRATANEQGHLFGSVNEREIAAALQELGHKITEDQIMLAAPIRTLDRYQVPVRLAEGFDAHIDLWVVPSEG